MSDSPPDRLAVWLMDRGFKPAGPLGNLALFARLVRGRTPDGQPDEIVLLFWSGDALTQGPGALKIAAELASIAEPSDPNADMFDALPAELRQRRAHR